MTYLVSDAIAETKRYLNTTYRGQVNTLSGALSSGTTSVSVTYQPGSVQPGAIIAVDLEEMLVLDLSGSTATVARGYRGSTAASHSSGALVYVNPVFSDWDVFRGIATDFQSLSANGLYRVSTVNFTYQPALQGYDLSTPTQILDVLEVRCNQPGPSKSWPRITKWTLDQNANTTDFASGNALILYESGFSGQTVQVSLATEFAVPSSVTDDFATLGLPPTANDIPCLGAAVRCLAGREVQRNFNETQGQPRRQEEVPPGANLGSGRNLALLRRERIVEEADRLANTFPTYRRY